MESFDQELKRKQDFDELFDRTLELRKGDSVPVVEYNLPYPKEDFLKYIGENKNVLLHGSSNKDLEKLEPRQANDGAKKFGNKKGVYAVKDPVLPIFHAIQDKEKLRGVIRSGSRKDLDTGEMKYNFQIPIGMVEIKPWKGGIIYIFNKADFTQGVDDDDELIDEWVSEKEVRPIAKLEVEPEDFRFLNEIEGYND